MRTVTLEMDNSTLQLMEVRDGKAVKWASHSLNLMEAEDGDFIEPEALGAVVKELVTSSGIRLDNVIVGISGQYSVSRLLKVVQQPGFTTEEAVMAAANEVMSLASDALYLYWQTVAAGDGYQQVLFIGIPRDMLDTQMRALKAAGINPGIVDFKPLALARAVSRKQALILNVDFSTFDIIIVTNGIPEVMHTTSWRADDLTNEEKAEHLATHLRLTVDFYKEESPEIPFDSATPFFITGQMSANQDMVEKLSDKVVYPVEPLAPLLEFPTHLPFGQYAVNIGLALRESAAAENNGADGLSLPNINFLPQAYKPWRPSARQIFSSLAVIAAIVLLVPLYQLTSGNMAETNALERKLESVNSLVELRKAELAKRLPLKNAITDYMTVVNLGGDITEDLGVIISEAEELGVELLSITRDTGSITIVCQADSYIAFRSYLTALEESGRFSTPIPPPEGYPYIKGGVIKLEPKPAK
ncbi:MAG: pilus assembly protein PilM [Dehalococcoidales bacterium]|nr:pilus assembly protein PilM [Dehalococcoidales bacterium]